MTLISNTLDDTCIIAAYTKTRTGMTLVESWVEGSPIRCRAIQREVSSSSPEKGTVTTMVKNRFIIQPGITVGQKDRVIFNGRTFDVIEVRTNRVDRRDLNQIIICRAIGRPE